MQTEPPLDTFVEIDISSQEAIDPNGKLGNFEPDPNNVHRDVTDASNHSVSRRRCFWNCDDRRTSDAPKSCSCCVSQRAKEASDQHIKDYFHGRNVLVLGGRLVCGPPEE